MGSKEVTHNIKAIIEATVNITLPFAAVGHIDALISG